MRRNKWVPMREGLWPRLGDSPPKTALKLLLRARGTASSLKLSDIGCGTGEDMEMFRAILKQNGYSGTVSVIGCDVSRTMSDYCRRWGLTVIQGDFRDHLEQFQNPDLVWSNMGLIHLSLAEFSDAIGMLVSACVPGGVLGIGFKTGDDDREGIDKADERVPVKRPTSYHSMSKVCNLLRRRGCTVSAKIDIPSEINPTYGYGWVFGIRQQQSKKASSLY
jgi:SAM-dependent methyltransferase